MDWMDVLMNTTKVQPYYFRQSKINWNSTLIPCRITVDTGFIRYRVIPKQDFFQVSLRLEKWITAGR